MEVLSADLFYSRITNASLAPFPTLGLCDVRGNESDLVM